MKVSYKQLKNMPAGEPLFIDVRSPGEYAEGTIGDAVNIPLYLDEDRVIIGTAYKQESPDRAKVIAMERVALRLPSIYQAVIELEKTGRPLVLFCARGGMRSHSLYQLLTAIGHTLLLLEGGYKAYRQIILEETARLTQTIDFVVLHGNTGVGKTLILKQMAQKGFCVMDIEDIANHRGSILGRVGLEAQPTQKQFEHRLYECLLKAEGSVLYVEAESKRLGRNTIPEPILEHMKAGKHIWIEASLETRADILVAEYMQGDGFTAEICKVLDMFKKHLGNETVEKMMVAVQNGEGHAVAKELMIRYYDPKYEYTSKQYLYDLSVFVESPELAANQIAVWHDSGLPKKTLLIEVSGLDADEIDLEALEKAMAPAAQLIASGETVAFPTETVYGLGANALNDLAVRKIFKAKGRPADNPLIVHIVERESLDQLVASVSDQAHRLMEAFWPGPLTLIMPKSDQVGMLVTAGLSTVAVRMPSHPVARALIKLSGCPIAAPSANLSGKPSPTTAADVVADLTGRVAAIVCGGSAHIGLESTVLDVTGDEPVVLRPGGVTLEQIQAVVGCGRYDEALNRKLLDGEAPKSPGMKYTHYSPEAEVIIVAGETDIMVKKIQSLVAEGLQEGLKIGIMTVEEHVNCYAEGQCVSLGSLADLEGVASKLFMTLREFDRLGVDRVYAEAFSQEGIGKAIMNRLIKAAGHHVIVAQ